METVLFGSYRVADILQYGAVAVAAVVAVVVLLKILRKPDNSGHVQVVQCTGCGWKGQVSRYAGRCPKCNTTLGDQRAAR